MVFMVLIIPAWGGCFLCCVYVALVWGDSGDNDDYDNNNDDNNDGRENVLSAQADV